LACFQLARYESGEFTGLGQLTVWNVYFVVKTADLETGQR
jgi:hypothetical protein